MPTSAAGAPGKTGKDTWMTEKDFNKIKKDNPNAEVFVTLGGDGVVFNDTGVIDRISDNLVEFYNSGFKFDGLDFDMESDFRNIGFDKCVDIVSKVKSGIGKSIKTQFTVLAGMCNGKTIADGCQYQTSLDEVDWLKTNTGRYDYLGLMLYGSSMTSSGYGITCNDTDDASGPTIDIIYKWITAGLKQKQTYSWYDCKRKQELLCRSISEDCGCELSFWNFFLASRDSMRIY